MHKVSMLRGLVAAMLLAGAMLVASCGDDNDEASGGSSTTTNAQVKNIPFASPEDQVPDAYPPPTPKALTVGILNPTSSSEVLTNMWDAAEREAKRLDGKVIIKSAELNPDTQISQFEQLLNENVDAIGMYGIVDPKALAPVLKQAAEQKVPVIAWDITPGQPVPVPGFASQVWQGRDEMVYNQVKAAAEALPEGAEVGIITPAFKVPLFLFTLERQKYWAQKFGLKVAGETLSKADTTVAGEQAATELLAKYPDIKGVLGYNDEPAIGASVAARQAGLRDMKTFGMTGGELGRGAVESGRLTATVFIDAAQMGKTMAQGLYDAAQGVKIPPVVRAPTAPEIVTKDNIDEVAAKEKASSQ